MTAAEAAALPARRGRGRAPRLPGPGCDTGGLRGAGAGGRAGGGVGALRGRAALRRGAGERRALRGRGALRGAGMAVPGGVAAAGSRLPSFLPSLPPHLPTAPRGFPRRLLPELPGPGDGSLPAFLPPPPHHPWPCRGSRGAAPRPGLPPSSGGKGSGSRTTPAAAPAPSPPAEQGSRFGRFACGMQGLRRGWESLYLPP